MKIDLAAMVKRTRKRVPDEIRFRQIVPTPALARDLLGIYMEVVKAWNDGLRESVLPAYTEAVAAIRDAAVRDDLNDLRRAGEALGNEIDRLLLTLTPAIKEWAVRVERWHRGQWSRAVLTPTGVDISTMIGPEDVRETLEAVVARNVSLVRSVSDTTRSRIADIVFRGFQKRTQTRDIGKELSEAIEMSRKRANMIAADQTRKLASQLDQERRRQAGIDKWEWIHSGKANFREEHKERDGNIYSDDDPPDDMPGEEPNCGCHSRAILVLADE